MSNVEPKDTRELGREDPPPPEDPGARPAAPRPRRGRPARINREIIGEAAHAIGLNDITLKAVADRLGVSVAGLYHHVDGRDDLLRLAAEHASRRVTLPEDRGQHWALWLREWAVYMREAFVAQPGLLGQYLEGAISAESIATTADAVLGLLLRQGFTIGEAQAAYQMVSSCAVGSAVHTIREQQATLAGRPPLAEHQRVLAQHRTDELPHLRRLVAEQTTSPGLPFAENLVSLLVGIAVRRGEPWEPVADELAATPALTPR